MDFIKTIIKVTDVAKFKKDCTPWNFGAVLMRLKMNTAFIIVPRTKPKYFLINMDNLMYTTGPKIFNILMSCAQYIREESSNYWLVMFYLTSIEKPWNDQRMFYFEQNKNRFQTILDFPCLSSNALTYVTETAYFSKSPQGGYYPLFRAGQNIISPMLEINPYQRVQMYINGLIPNRITDGSSIEVYRSNTDPGFTTTDRANGWTLWGNDVSVIYDKTNFNMVYNMFYIVVPSQTYISILTQGGTNPGPINTFRNYQGLSAPRSSPLLVALIASVNNKQFFANLFNPTYPPGGLQGNNTLGSGSTMIMDVLTYWGLLDAPANTLGLNFYPVKTPIAVTSLQAQRPAIFGYIESFAFHPAYRFVQMDMDPNIQDSIISLQEQTALIDTFDGATTTVRLGENNICSDLAVEEFGPFLRSEVYHFDLLKYSPYVQLFVEGLGGSAFGYVNFKTGYQFELGGVKQSLKSTSDQTTWNWFSRSTNPYKCVYRPQYQNFQTRNTVNHPDPPGDIPYPNQDDNIKIYPQMMTENKSMGPYLEYSPVDGYGGRSLGKSNGWTRMRKGFFNSQGYNKAPPQGNAPYTGWTLLLDDDPRYPLCQLKIGVITITDALPAYKRLGVVIDGPVCVHTQHNLTPRWSNFFYMDMVFPKASQLYKINYDTNQLTWLKFGSNVRNNAAYGNPTLTSLNLKFDVAILTPGDYICWINTQDNGSADFQFNPKTDFLPTIWFGPQTCADTWFTENGYTMTIDDLIAPGFQQGESYNNAMVANMWDKYSINSGRTTGCGVCIPGRVRLNQFGCPEKLDVRMVFDFAGIWNIFQSTKWQWVKFFYDFGAGNSSDDRILRVDGVDLGYRAWRFYPNLQNGEWQTRDGIKQITWNFKALNKDCVQVRFYFLQSAGDGAVPAHELAIPPYNDVASATDIYYNLLTAYYEFFPTSSYKFVTATQSYTEPNVTLEANDVLALVLDPTRWNPYAGHNLNVYVFINKPSTVNSVYSYYLTKMWYQEVYIETACTDPQLRRPWKAYQAIKEELGGMTCLNPDLANSSIIKFTYTEPLYIGQPWAGVVHFLYQADQGAYSIYRTVYNVIVEDKDVTKEPVLETNYSIPSGRWGGTTDVGGTWYTDTQDDPVLLMNLIRQCNVTGTSNNIRFDLISGPVVGSQASRQPVLTMSVYGWQSGVTLPAIFYTRVLKASGTAINPSYFLNIKGTGTTIPAAWDKAFIRFELYPSLTSYPTYTFPFVFQCEFTTGTTTSLGALLPSTDPGMFQLDTTWKPVTQSLVSYLVVIPSQPATDTFRLSYIAVDLNAPTVINGITFYTIIFQTNTLEPIGVDAVALEINFAPYNWDNTKNWGYAIQIQIFDYTAGTGVPKYQTEGSIAANPNNSLFAGSEERIYIETPITNVWGYYSDIYLKYPKSVRFWIEFDLALVGGKRDYIWDQFKHICACTYKQGDHPRISNQMVLCDACDNKGYGNVKNFLLYNRYNGEEFYIWQKFVKKPQANFYISFCPLASSPYYTTNYLLSTEPVWDINLERYLTIYFK